MKRLLTRFDITDIERSSVYLRRWSLALPFGWSVKLHHILRPDSDRCQHDHPWGFWTLILWGGYFEEVGAEQKINHLRPWRIAWRPPSFRHRILSLPRGHAWTLVLTRRRVREWGFYTNRGWMQWRLFVDAARSARVLWCHDGQERGKAHSQAAARRGHGTRSEDTVGAVVPPGEDRRVGNPPHLAPDAGCLAPSTGGGQ